MKFSFDIHGVIDCLPEVFKVVTNSLYDSGHEIHILTGATISDELINYLNTNNIKYTHLFSILDYHREIGTPTRENHPTYSFPMIDDHEWDRTKGDYCKRHRIDLHIDDTTVYNDHFTTPFARLWTHNNKPKPVHKDPRHLK